MCSRTAPRWNSRTLSSPSAPARDSDETDIGNRSYVPATGRGTGPPPAEPGCDEKVSVNPATITGATTVGGRPSSARGQAGGRAGSGGRPAPASGDAAEDPVEGEDPSGLPHATDALPAHRPGVDRLSPPGCRRRSGPRLTRRAH